MKLPDNATRFARLPAPAARALWLVLAAVLLASAWLGARTPPSAATLAVATGPATSAAAQHDADLDLYRTVTARVAAGQDYYRVVAEEHRTQGYPLRPFVTVRLPTLAWIMAALGERLAHVLLLALGLATVLAWHVRLRGRLASPFQHRMTVLLLLTGLTLAAQVRYLPLHELWAGTLVALSLALHRPQRWGASLVVAALALALRELVLPFVLLMAAFALFERRWRELAAWSALVIAFAAAMVLHMQEVAAVVTAADPLSPAWVQFGGLQAALNFAHHTSGLRLAPAPLGFPLVPLCLLGWAGWQSRTGLFGSLLLAGYGLLFALTGRPNNVYWGLIVTPLLAMGLAFLPRALRDLWRAARRASR